MTIAEFIDAAAAADAEWLFFTAVGFAVDGELGWILVVIFITVHAA